MKGEQVVLMRGPKHVAAIVPVSADELELPPRLSELAILVTARVWRAAYEWSAHEGHALKAGLDAAVVADIRAGRQPKLARADDAAIYQLARELHESRAVGDATYERAVEVLGEAKVVELVALLGYYALVAMTINAFAVDPPEGGPPPFAD